MANSIPLTFRSAPFPEGYKADPEQMKNDLVARLYAESTESISFFASGSVAPSSNVGPWLKNGEEWYIWSNTLGAYIPQVLDPISLGYVAQLAAPDPAVYTFWIELDGAGKAIAIKYYSGGAWKDVYEDKFALYLTIAAAAAAYQPLNSNLTTITTSTLGDIIYSSAANTLAKLAGNTAAAKRFLTQTGTGAVSAAPVWSAIVAGDIPDISATYLTVATAAATYQTLAGMSAYAPLASPTFTGTPAAPTAAPGTNTTQIATTAFVDAAVSAIPGAVAGTNNFRAFPSSNQDIVHGAGGTLQTDISFGSETFDPDGVFGSSVFTAPATGYYQFTGCLYFEITAGTPTILNTYFDFVSSGGQTSASGGLEGQDAEPRFNHGGDQFYLTVGQTVKVTATTAVDAAGTVRVVAANSYFSGFRVR